MQTEYAQLDNLNVEQQEVLITPKQLKLKLPVNENVRSAVNGYRQTVRNIVDLMIPGCWSLLAHAPFMMSRQ